MKKLLQLFIVLILYSGISVAQDNSKSRPLTDQERLRWFQDAKFGLFIHWGVYSEAGGEWKGEPTHAEWLMFRSEIPLAEYKEYAKTFNPEKFNAKEWVSIAKNAGMKYIVITAKHHDGFAMYDSEVSSHNIVEGSAFKRDPLKELSVECQKQGLQFCVYYSLGRDWEDPDCPTGREGRTGWRSNLVDYPYESKKDLSKYLERKAMPQIRELLTNYGPIGIFWFDTYEQVTREQGQEIFDMIRELQPNCVINNRVGPGLGDYKVNEQHIPDGTYPKPWESCMTMNNHWGYYKADNDWKSEKELVHQLIDIVSKGGNLLLNVGPTGEGLIPQPSVERLAAMGDWLRVNGEAIYGARASSLPRPEWGRYTSRRGLLYAHVFDWPGDGRLEIDNSLIVKKAVLIAGNESPLKVETSNAGDAVLLPESAPNSIATVIRLEVIPSEDWADLSRYSEANSKIKAPDPKVDRVVFMGNSITEFWLRYDSEFFRSNPYINRGIAGQTTAQMLVRFRPDVLELQPKVVIIHAGTNDIAANTGPMKVPQIAGNIFSMAELAKANGIKVVLAAVMPATSYSWRPGIFPADKIIELNQLIEAYARENNMVYLDYYTPMVNTEIGLKKEYGRDTVHPSAAGYKIMGALVKEAINKALNK